MEQFPLKMPSTTVWCERSSVVNAKPKKIMMDDESALSFNNSYSSLVEISGVRVVL